MATTTNILILLKYYAMRQNNAQVNITDFLEYIKRYAQHHLEEQPELVQYLSNTSDVVKKELEKLIDTKQIFPVLSNSEKQIVVVLDFYLEKINGRYQEIISNPSIPYPAINDLPKNTPEEIFHKEQADIFFSDMLGNAEIPQKQLFCLQIPRNLPAILIPSITPVVTLLEIALLKLQRKLKKEEYHDYFLKKLKIANPGKELSIKNFFGTVTAKPDNAIESIKNSAESFYQWNQLCFFIRQDFEKVKDLTQEDISLLQSVFIIEFCISFYRNKAQQDLQRTTALKNLELLLNKPPYYFSKDTINMFSDSRGIPLLGQYSENDLTEYLHTATTESADNLLPPLLTFKTDNGIRYYISKTKVIPLIIRLCTDAREIIREDLIKEVFTALKNFKSVPETKNQQLFEQRLEAAVKEKSPVLYSLINARFLRALYYEMRTSHDSSAEAITLYRDGDFPPYSELLMISKEEILTDSKIMLPFWYSIPFISWILSLFCADTKDNMRKTSKDTKSMILESQDKIRHEVPPAPLDRRDPVVSRKAELKQAALDAEKHYVPDNSTLERELTSYELMWNRMLNKQARENLTDDVNSLIRDYMRKIIKTLRANNFTPERIRNLAETLAKTPNMQKIKDHDDLCMYIQLYMVKLIKNLQ